MFGKSRQVYYRRKKREETLQLEASIVVNLVQEVRGKLPRVGTRKLHYMLNIPLKKINIGRDSLFRIMKANHMDIKPKRSYHVTTQSHHRFRKHKNLVEKINVNRPEQVWVSDITYIGSRGSHLYLALVTDAYSKKIMGYDLSKSLCLEGSVRALKMAVKQRKYNQDPLIHHSDRGLQYCSDEYQDVLYRNNITPSMTEKYDPYANAVAERVNGILKDEFMIEEYKLAEREMSILIKDSIEKYNRIRPHYSCYMLTPEEMHLQNQVVIRTYKKSTSLLTSQQRC